MIAKFACGVSKLKKSEIVVPFHTVIALYILIDVDFGRRIYFSLV